jgi:hypothetical protein
MAALPGSALLAVEVLGAGGRGRTAAGVEELFNRAGYELVRAVPVPAAGSRPYAVLEGRRS